MTRIRNFIPPTDPKVLWHSDSFLLTLTIEGRFHRSFLLHLQQQSEYMYYSLAIFNPSKLHKPSKLPQCIRNYFIILKYCHNFDMVLDDDHFVAVNSYKGKFKNTDGYYTHIVTCNITPFKVLE